MAEELHIGELARRSGRSAHTLRWYESQGLMPGVLRDGGGRRVYNEQHIEWLELVSRLRHTGMTVAEIRRYAELAEQGKKTLRQRRQVLQAHRRTVENAIVEWTQALELIDRKIDFYGKWITTGRRPRLSTVVSPAETPSALPATDPSDRTPARRSRVRAAR